MARRRGAAHETAGNVQSERKKVQVSEEYQKVSEEPLSAKQQQEKRTVALKWKILLLVIFLPPFLNYASLQREEQELRPKDAEMIDIGLGQKISLICKGQGQPVVMLDAPTGMSSDIWHRVQEKVSQSTKVCAYDRAGLGFSRRALQNETIGMEKVWRLSTIGRMVDDLHQLVKAAGIATPFILVGSELGALNGRFYTHIYDSEVSDLVLINPIPEDIFEDEMWERYWYTRLLPSLQIMQLAAATGVSRLLLILRVLEPSFGGDIMSGEMLQRQKYLLSNPAHQSSAVDEHYFMNESMSQVREISKFKLLSSRTSLSAIIGDSFDDLVPAHLNQVFADLQRKCLKRVYPQAKLIHIQGADRYMISKKASWVSKHLLELVSKRQTKHAIRQ
ncbi:hypothetical protein KOW79_018909 [Hemibagrus wyckioides]|uniref:AB hydrolase-1 domain-containing protein n=1 Tax=Hemibagrus wyckioides TaxID=337641 RepID=A0A9D3N8J6_9TELE|nr:uncharacterized protein si:dkey-122a22.2 isoform X1 [Hemibagrus wyckioides]KAG7317874.1 hypothetical protein KOW79_018909 [Hemibagrus wyckioides]